MIDLSAIQTSISDEERINTRNISSRIEQVDDEQITLKEKEELSNSKSSRWLRIVYAIIAILFAVASVIFWMRFVQFYYDPNKHSDTFFATLTTACTINILAAFISIIKGLFPKSE